MRILKGIPVSPGIAIGRAFFLHGEEIHVPKTPVSKEQIPTEIARFEDALTRTRAELLSIRRKISKEVGREHSDIFNAHLLILEDRTLVEDVIEKIKMESVATEYAFSSIIQRYAHAFSQIDDEYLRERMADIRDIGRRVLRNLVGGARDALAELDEEVIIIAHDLSPSDTATMDREKVIGFATDIGGPTSHTAIMARSLEIPAVVGLPEISQIAVTGNRLIIDGTHGVVIIDPDQATIEQYLTEEKKFDAFVVELDKLKDLPAETADKHRITLAANIEFPDEIPSVIAHGADGIGLYRTEYIYLNRPDLPSEEEQFAAYKKVVEAMKPQAVVVRTLDLGGDKFLSSLDLPHEMNPFLGWRAIRFCLTRVDVFKTQLRAILKASAFGNLRVMYPMITNLGELISANKILAEVKEELRKEGQPFNQDIPVGAMIEIPSAALTSDILAKEVSFFSIGSNDLIQYSLAVDRVNEKIAYLYEPTHPAILKLIKQVVENGHNAHIEVAACGEMSGDPALAVILLGLGIDTLSTSSFVLPKIKKTIRAVSRSQAQEIAHRALQFSNGSEIKRFALERLNAIIPGFTEWA